MTVSEYVDPNRMYGALATESKEVVMKSDKIKGFVWREKSDRTNRSLLLSKPGAALPNQCRDGVMIRAEAPASLSSNDLPAFLDEWRHVVAYLLNNEENTVVGRQTATIAKNFLLEQWGWEYRVREVTAKVSYKGSLKGKGRSGVSVDVTNHSPEELGRIYYEVACHGESFTFPIGDYQHCKWLRYMRRVYTIRDPALIFHSYSIADPPPDLPRCPAAWAIKHDPKLLERLKEKSDDDTVDGLSVKAHRSLREWINCFVYVSYHFK